MSHDGGQGIFALDFDGWLVCEDSPMLAGTMRTVL